MTPPSWAVWVRSHLVCSACEVCEGKKFVIPEGERCEGCQGTKTIRESKIISVEIEKGMQWGQNLAFYGEADQFPDTITGDLVFQLTPKKDVKEVKLQPLSFGPLLSPLFCYAGVSLISFLGI